MELGAEVLNSHQEKLEKKLIWLWENLDNKHHLSIPSFVKYQERFCGKNISDLMSSFLSFSSPSPGNSVDFLW